MDAAPFEVLQSTHSQHSINGHQYNVMPNTIAFVVLPAGHLTCTRHVDLPTVSRLLAPRGLLGPLGTAARAGALHLGLQVLCLRGGRGPSRSRSIDSCDGMHHRSLRVGSIPCQPSNNFHRCHHAQAQRSPRDKASLGRCRHGTELFDQALHNLWAFNVYLAAHDSKD